MSAPPEPQSLYLTGSPEPIFVTVHDAGGEGLRDTAVVLCPPFGWDEVSSYRSLRSWAYRLAADGHPTVRLSLPGTGDSGGSPYDPGLVGAWVESVTAASDWIRVRSGARRVAVIGIGLGGLLACLAMAEGASIDDLLLWGTPVTGRSLVRQLGMFSKLEAAQFFRGLPQPPALPEGQLEAGGFAMSPETVSRLQSIDLGRLELPVRAGRRALLLVRDGVDPDPALTEMLERADIATVTAPGDGFADMTSHPERAVPPLAVFEQVSDWLKDAGAPSGPPASGTATVIAEPEAMIKTTGGATVRELPIRIPVAGRSLSGVVVAPADPPEPGLCVVLLNAGAVRRIGPNRMWVEAARRWAGQGVPTVRLDMPGIGESDGDEASLRSDGAFLAAEFVGQVLQALDVLQANGVGTRFVLGGLCSGSYWALHAALRDPRVCGTLLANPGAVFWQEGLGAARDLRAALTQRPSISKLRREATPERLREIVRWLLRAPGRWLRRLWSREPPTLKREVDSALEALIASGKPTLLMFSENDPVYTELAAAGWIDRLEEASNVTLERIAVRDHTMRPSWSQHRAHEALDRALAAQPGTSIRAQPAEQLTA